MLKNSSFFTLCNTLPPLRSTGMKFRYGCARANTPQRRKRGKYHRAKLSQSSACLCASRLAVNRRHFSGRSPTLRVPHIGVVSACVEGDSLGKSVATLTAVPYVSPPLTCGYHRRSFTADTTICTTSLIRTEILNFRFRNFTV